MVAVTWCSSGCRDNPGFALLPGDPQGETSASTGDPPAPTGTSTQDPSSTSDGDATATSMVDPTTGDPGDTSSDTTAPAAKCGDGTLDPGEVCDDGNQIPGDGCDPVICRPLFVPGFSGDFGELCSALVSGTFDADGVTDLAVRRPNTPSVHVLQNDGDAAFTDQNHMFTFEIATSALAVQDIDHDGYDDIVGLQGGGQVYFCRNDHTPDPTYCFMGELVPHPNDFGTVVEGVLQVVDVTDDSNSDILIATDARNIGYAAHVTTGVFEPMVSIKLPAKIVAPPTSLAFFRIVAESDNLDLVVGFGPMPMVGNVSIVPDFLNNATIATGPYPVGKSASDLAVVQLGILGDLPDILSLDEAGKQLWIVSDSNQAYETQDPPIAVGGVPTRLFPVALRGPGKQDIVVLDESSTSLPIVVFDAGEVTQVYKMATGLAAPLVGVAFADLDGDSDLDVAALDGACNLSVQLNQTKP